MPPRKHAITVYADQVASGKVPAGTLHRLACERHLADLAAKRFRFDAKVADAGVTFFPKVLRHYKGEWARQPIELQPWQAFIVGSLWGWRKEDGTRRFRVGFAELCRGQGKSTIAGGLGILGTFFDGEPGAEGYSIAPLDLDTPVPTPSGWTTIGDVQVGDYVFDDAGKPTRVCGLSPVYTDRTCYEIVFHDGSTIVADAEHRWCVTSVVSGQDVTGTPRSTWRPISIRRGRHVLTTAEIAASIHTKWGSRNHAIELAGALDLPDTELPIPPYTLGVWLGDGRSNRGSICMHPSDVEVWGYIQEDGFQVQPTIDGRGLSRGAILGLRTYLRTHGLLDNKHVPAVYLRSSRRQRLALLQGLMDTDGTATKTGECRFSNANERLACAVYELASSLGILAHKREMSVNGVPHFLVSFKADQSVPVFRLKRKLARLRVRRGGKALRRYIVAVNEVPSRPVRCLSVASPSHLFLVGRGMVATHNTKKDQARIVFDAARRMVLASPGLMKRIVPQQHALVQDATASKFVPLGADADTLDGLRPHVVIADEVHAHKSADVIEIMQTGMGTRRQPLMFEITTAGQERLSIWWQHREYGRQILEGRIDDDTFYAFIACADEDDDWQSPATWQKANPNYGISVKPEFLEAECRKAVNMPAYEPTFRRLHCGQLVEQHERLISRAQWDACAQSYTWDVFAGRPVYAGLDLSSTTDLTACTWMTIDPDGKVRVWPQVWIPEAKLANSTDRVPYRTWAAQGWLTVTPGAVVDYERVRADILARAKTVKLQQLGFDPWNATESATKLAAELGDQRVVEVRQGYASMSEPTKRLLALLASGQLVQPGNPVMTWTADNLAVSMDPAGNLKPDKDKSRQRIDSMVALLNALYLWLRQPVQTGHAYDRREVLVL